MPHQIVQLTDCHLFADPAAELKGIVTRPRFDAVMAAIRDRFPDFDRLVITGDLAHDEALATYDHIRTALDDWVDRTRVIPGNHDNREFMSAVFPPSDAVATFAAGHRVTFAECLGDWQIIGLDTQRPGESIGEIGDDQINWLRSQLESQPDVPAFLLTHHPPIKVHSRWLDRIGLEDATKLGEVARDFLQVRLIASGHVHQSIGCAFETSSALTTASVGPAFEPRTETIVISGARPRFRVIELDDNGAWWTQMYSA